MLVLPERERTKKGAIGVETKGVTCKIPLDLHNQISEEIRETESTISKFIEMVIMEHYEKGAVKVMEKGRTLAFQVSEELFQRVKEYLENYEKAYHRRLTQKEFVIGLIEQALEEAEEEFEAARAAEQTAAIPEYPGSIMEHLQRKKATKTAPKQDGLQRMVDREAKRAEGKGAGYDRWASLHNLKQMAATHNFLMENELLDLDKLDAAVESSRKALSEARESLRGIEQSISDKKNLRKVVSDYRRTRPTIDAHKKLSGKKAEAYYRANEADFIIYEAALRQLKVLAPGKKLPATSKLNTEIEALISEKNAAYNTYRTAKAEYEQLATAKRNAEQILHGTPSRQKKHEQER